MSTETLHEEKTEVKEKLNKRKFLVLINDDHNTFEWVIDCLMTVCKHTRERAEQSAMIVHTKKKCDVYEGDTETLMSMKMELQLRGLTVEINED
jgi:ATP-dependent Clp protease adaptor protein ClpS